MKILFIGDYSGVHGNLSRELRRRGYECTVLSDGCGFMDTERDINLVRRPGKIGGLLYIMRLITLLPRLRGYDIVQLTNPNFLRLRPAKLRLIFKWLKRNNCKVGLTLAGTDPFYVNACLDSVTYRYSDYMIGAKKSPYALSKDSNAEAYTTPEMMEYCAFIYDNIDIAVSLLYEYHISAAKYLNSEKLKYIGIPINIEECFVSSAPLSGRLRMLLGMKSNIAIIKGTDRLLRAAQRLQDNYPELMELKVVSDLPLAKYKAEVKWAHILLDQLYSYTPAKNALEAMAAGKIVVSGGETEYYDFIGERELTPVINAIPDDDELYSLLQNLITKPREELQKIKEDSRQFVKKHNDVKIVADRFVNAWQPILSPLSRRECSL